MSDASMRVQGASKLVRGVVTPEGVEVFVRLASLGERASALALDLAIMIAALIVLGFAALLFDTQVSLTFGIIALFLLRAFYFTGFEIAWNGSTPGKRMTSLRVLNRRGGSLAPAAVIGRNLMREVELFLPLSLVTAGAAALPTGPWTDIAMLTWVAVLAALPLFNRDRLRAGDMVAGTWVVVAPRRVLLPDLAAVRTLQHREADIDYRFTEAQLAVYGVRELQLLEDVLRASGDDVADMRRDVAQRIARKIGHAVIDMTEFDSARFLEAFYAAQRRRLETELAFGRRRRDKNDR